MEKNQAQINQQELKNQTTQPKKRPDEVGGINVSANLKIFDPKNREVFVEHRG